MIPARVALALQKDGWWLRSAMPWVKRSVMPESVSDRPTNALEYVFMLTKKARYFFDAEAVRQNVTSGPSDIKKMIESKERIGGLHKNLDCPLNKASKHTNIGRKRAVGDPSGRAFRNTHLWYQSMEPPYGLCGVGDELVGMDVNLEGMKEAHFATFGPKFVRPLMLCGTSAKGYCPQCGKPWVRVVERQDKGWDGSEYGKRAVAATGGASNGGTQKSTLGSGHGKLTGEYLTTGWRPTCTCGCEETRPGIVLDPFGGSGTTGVVAAQEKRDYVLIELNPEYAHDIAEPRLAHMRIGVPVREQRAGQLGLFETPAALERGAR